MGALHKGHISLIKLAQQHADIVVCSIFVNPTQFTDPKDLEKYPTPLEHDMAMLEECGCDGVFMPTVKEMYPCPEQRIGISILALQNFYSKVNLEKAITRE